MMTAVRQAGNGQPPGVPGADEVSAMPASPDCQPDASSEVAAVQTVGAVLSDLVEVAERLPVPPDQAETVARILDRLAEEIGEAATLLRQAQPETGQRPALAP